MTEGLVLDPDSHRQLGHAIAERIESDHGLLERSRSEIRPLRSAVRRIHPRSTTAVSLVGTDGGNNKVEFDSFLIQIIRVVTRTTRSSALRRQPHRCGGHLSQRAGHLAEAVGIPLWCQDEAGPYQAIPQPGQSWQPEGKPRCQPHEYIRGGTAKLLTLFRPATGEVRAKGVSRAPNAVLHPWLKNELLQILEELPEVAVGDTDAPAAARWASWLGHVPHLPLPPLRLLLIWDNLAGHLSTDMVTWLFAHGIMPLYTPISGSWLNMAESVQRIICDRALRGQHPKTAKELITWLEDAVAGWNPTPTPFIWDGKRRERRIRAKQRRLGGSAATILQPQLIAA